MAQALKRHFEESPVPQSGLGLEEATDNPTSGAFAPKSPEDDRVGTHVQTVDNPVQSQEPVVRQWQRRIVPEVDSWDRDGKEERWNYKRALGFMAAFSGAAWGLIIATAALNL